MALQKSNDPIIGKVGQQSYYYTRNGGYQVRQINPNMSERVKTEPAFANTRLNAREFGAAGDCAAAIIRAVSQRWRFILTPKSVGLTTKSCVAAMRQDETAPWGRRQIRTDQMPDVQAAFNALSKSSIPASFKQWVDSKVVYDEANEKVDFLDNFGIDSGEYPYYENLGVTDFQILCYNFRVTVPQWYEHGERQGYLSANANLSLFKSTTVQLDQDWYDVAQSSIEWPPQNSLAVMGGLLFIVQPIKKINTHSHILQKLCSAYWKSIPDAG